MVCEIHVIQFPDCEMVEISNGMICSKTCCATWIFTAEDNKFWIEKRKQKLASCQFLVLKRKRVLLDSMQRLCHVSLIAG
jgi:hypothetical protein